MSTKRNTQHRPEISIVITCHKEGILAHKTILSLLKSAQYLDNNNLNYEFIVNIDNPDKDTSAYFERWKNDSRFKISEVSFGNPADNRNDAIRKAQGKYISLIDGDDLISELWLISAYNIMQKTTEPTVLRPAIHAQFGYEEGHVSAWLMRDSSTKDVDAIQMSYWNLWTNAIFAQKKLLENNPYKAPVDGFGFEDYQFNADMRAKNIHQKTVPETVLWYRKRADSVSSFHVDSILGYSELFSIPYIKSIPLQEVESHRPGVSQRMKTNSKRAYRFAFDTAKKIRSVNQLLSPVVRNIMYKKNRQRTPSWFIKAWKQINTIENQLWPTRGEVAKIQFHPLSFDPFHTRFGFIYQRLCHAISNDKLDYLFLAPAMSGSGGTEKLIANYIKALQKTHPSWNIGILSTQPFNQATVDYFRPLGVDMLDFGRLTIGVGDYEKNVIWSRLLIHSKVKRLHTVNDAYWYHWIARQQDFIIQTGYNIYISLFMREYVHEKGRILSFADPDLVQIWPSVTKVFTDNQRVINDALDNNAFDKEKLITHYQPQDVAELIAPKTINRKKPIRVLWASRISHQKRPDILKKIADKLGNDYIIDAYGIIEKRQYKATYFDSSKVNYRGSFSGLDSIPTQNYDIYLYTSQTDGIPNILMEVSAAGLPIVASDIGGVSEFIHHNKTGLLVDLEDIDGYVAAIQSLTESPEATKKLVTDSQDLLQNQHLWDNFISKVKRDIT